MSQKLTSFEIQKRLPIGIPSTNENIYGSIQDCQVQGYSDRLNFDRPRHRTLRTLSGSSSSMIPA